MKKICPRCKSTFTCNHDKIEVCWCNHIQLDKDAYQYISTHFEGCLCKECTEEIQRENENNRNNLKD
ncbi:MAG: cysteine-rich CWC family protein [Prolixibacteraceae bacterium]|jgi:hypothetical protein|nr:cysteine-rich CWC family protein [Prolixibacteraceae bacterium]